MKVAVAKHSELQNPREFVQSAPLPLPPHRGIKIQARNFNVYNASIPNRDEIRKDNYNRRLKQMTSMGFSTPINKPYKVIGDPLYLEQKQIILNGLGQLTNASNNQEVKNQFEKSNQIKEDNQKEKTEKVITKFSFGNLKNAKELIDLQSEVSKIKNFVRYVKLGHSFFDLIKQEEKIKKEKIEEEKRKSSTSMQIRPYEDSEIESDELTDEEYDVSLRSNPTSAFTSKLDYSQSRLTTSSKKQPKEPPKPYTPVYSSLLSKNDNLANRDMFVRELCVLLWLLESINVEPPNVIGPLRNCFQIKEITNNKQNEKTNMILRSKTVENEWNNFKKETTVKQSFKYQVPKDDRLKLHKKKIANIASNIINDTVMTEDTYNDDEIESLKMLKTTADTPSSELYLSVADFDLKSSNKGFKKDEIKLNLNVRDSIETTTQQDTTNLNIALPTPSLVNNSEYLLKTETNRESVISDSARDGVVTSTVRIDSNNNNNNNNHLVNEIGLDEDQIMMNRRRRKAISLRANFKLKARDRPIESTLTEQEMQLLRIGDPDELEHLFTKINSKNEKKNSKELRADNGPIHPLWTEKVLNYQKSLLSAKKSAKIQELKDQFNNVTDENAIVLHNRLEEIERKRISNCLTKYNHIDVKERGIHKMIYKMTKCVADKHRAESTRKVPNSQYHSWFLELEELIENNYKDDDSLLILLIDKLSIFGKLSAKKMNETAFFKTLDTLRVWELLSPEVMTAVEFCRERILYIPLDQFDSWFMSKHPQSFVPRADPDEKKRKKSSVTFKN